MYSRPRPRRIVSPKVLRVFRAAGWRYSSHRRAWVFAPLSGRIGPVLRLAEAPQPTNPVTIASSDSRAPTSQLLFASLPQRLPGASLHPAPLRVVTNPVHAQEPAVALSVELELELEQELAVAGGAKAADNAEPESADSSWPFLVGPSTIRTVASGPALSLVAATSNPEFDVDAARAAAPFRLPQRINPAMRGVSGPAPAPSRNAARQEPLLPGEPRSG